MPQSLERLLSARHHDPFAFLGLHPAPEGWVLRVFRPAASRITLLLADAGVELTKVDAGGLFEWRGKLAPPRPWRLAIEEGKHRFEITDPYAFGPLLSDQEMYLFNEGKLLEAWRSLGGHSIQVDGVDGVRFAVWAPNAERVSVVGGFNNWDGRIHAMRARGGSGIWELFIPGLAAGDLYKFEIRNRDTGAVMVKADPFARQFEMRPSNAAVVPAASTHAWNDSEWMHGRAKRDWLHSAMNIYEIHAGSWKLHADGTFYNWRELADTLVPYAADMGYTHIELMPVTEHPLDASWGYQTTGYFAPSSRFGSADDFRHFVDACHRAGLGVLLDWVPGHFPMDAWALARFDGTALFEHEDPRLGVHQDWGTYIFNYGRAAIKGFLLSSAHVMVHERFPGALTIAEESTAWPMVSRPVYLGGLGFSMKWNMGWMNDTLDYMAHDPVYRRYNHERLTFGQLYAYSENFVLPLSHDEVVHGKSSLLGKMPGDEWQRFANLRLLLAYQMMAPGKKLQFMGAELGQTWEWRAGEELPWHLLQYPLQAGVKALVRDLNRLYVGEAALHELDFSPEGFQWIDCHDADQSVVAWLRRGRDGRHAVVVLNFTPVPRHNYRLGVPLEQDYLERMNTDSAHYGGSDLGNGGRVTAQATAWMGFPASVSLTLPPLAALVLLPA